MTGEITTPVRQGLLPHVSGAVHSVSEPETLEGPPNSAAIDGGAARAPHLLPAAIGE